MKYWTEEYVEIRDIYEGEFRSPITTPALKGKILNTNNDTIGLYELEIIKEPCALAKRIDLATMDTIEDMCVMFEYRIRSEQNLVGERITTAPLPLSEMTQELQDILINAHLLF